MAEVTGVTLVAIQDSDDDSVAVRQGLVAFQTVIDVVDSLPESFGIDQGVHPSEGIGAAYRLPEPTAKEAGVGDEFQSMEAAHPGPEQGRDRFDHTGGRDAWLWAPIHDAGDDLFGEVKDLLGISDQ